MRDWLQTRPSVHRLSPISSSLSSQTNSEPDVMYVDRSSSLSRRWTGLSRPCRTASKTTCASRASRTCSRGWVGRWMDPTFISLVVRALRNACRRAWRRGRVRGAPCPRVSVDDYVPPRACGILWRMWMFFPRSGLCARIDMCFEIKLVKIALDSHM